MKRFSADTSVFFFKLKLFVSLLMAVWIFFSAASISQNGPRMKIHIRNASQDTSVP